MKELNQEQHIQLLQFMSLMQTCKTEEELQALKEQYFNIPRYEFLQDYISEKSENQSLSSYKTSLIYEMDKYQHDYKIVYGENFPAYKKETMPNNKADYTVIHLLNEISECDDIEAYQKLMEEKNRFPRVKIEALSHEFTGIYFSNENELPTNIILNSPESNFNARRQLVEAGYSPFTLPSVEDVRENGFEWLHEEISHFKETLNPNFIEQETQRNQEPEFNEQEYEEEYDDFIEPMDENDGMSAMAAEADYNGSLIENEDIDESLNTEFSNNDIPVENNEVEQEPEPENESQNYENNNSNVSAPKPKNKQELHQFFINNPYTSGTPVPTIAMRNEQTGHSTFIEGYEFARLEDIGKPNPAFRDENGKQIKPDGQTVVLTKPAFKEVIDEETGEKKLVPDDKNRKFIRISRDLYEQAIKNSEIIAKRNPKTEQEKQKMLDDYLEAAHLDEKKQLANTASNFWHNYKAGVMTIANNKQEAMAFAKRLVIEMIPSEREKFAAMVREYEKLRGTDGKHLSYDQRIIDFYDNMGLKITNNSIWRDHVDEKYNTLDAIKQNTEVFDKEGQPLDKSCRMKIGDTIKMSVTVDSALSNKKIKLPIQEYRLVAHSKDNNSVALISADGKQKIIKNREDFIKEVQKVEKKLMKKQQREDRYESISM
ncbi:MAG: hypothetical protein SPG48_06265 [Treponema sp.]|nr:hypothetical protein [Treponema sp.]MDY5683144.1 hypothetical protein [Treponema sp.]